MEIIEMCNTFININGKTEKIENIFDIRIFFEKYDQLLFPSPPMASKAKIYVFEYLLE